MRTRIIIFTAIVWLMFFALAKVVFALCCGEATMTEIAVAWWHGLPIDMSTTGYFMALPLIVVWVSLVWPRLPLRRVLMPWYALCAVIASAAVVVDTSLYPFWQFKLDATILNYIDSPTDALASVSVWYVVWRSIVFITVAAALYFVLSRCVGRDERTPRRATKWPTLMWHCVMPVWCGLLFIIIRGGVSESTMNVGVAYHSQRMFMNHVAVNPVFSFIASMSKTNNFAAQFDLLPEDECQRLFDTLYPSPAIDYSKQTANHRTSIISHKIPNVLVIIWESGSGTFFSPFGGTPDVMVNLERIADEGILFSNMYCNSWRTDRGMVSALSGWFAYPTLTLMRLPVICDRLPCLGRSFEREGYDTFFMYGGDINFTHTAGYLTAGGYAKLISDKDFSIVERHTNEWGVQDEIVFDRLFTEVVEHSRSGHPWHGGMLTLSSHAPFEVPYHKYEDEVLNSIAYTDHCLGQFINRLKTEHDVWNNLLVVILPDHGFSYNGMSYTHPLFFHAPMVWTGGVVREASVVDCVMNQSDMPATLLGALGMRHDDFPYSRDVMDSTYTYPFAYSAATEQVILTDSCGRAVLNIKTMEAIEGDDTVRLKLLKAILQTSYDILESKK